MQVLTLILSALAFLTGSAALVLVLCERKRIRSANKALRKTLVDYVAKEAKETTRSLVDYVAKEAKETTRSLVDYVDREAQEIAKGLSAGVKEQTDAMSVKVDKAIDAVRVTNRRIDVLKKTVKADSDRIEQLEQGCVPDFEEAMRAVNAVNEMNSGIANIWGFEPMDALRKSRQEGK